MPDVFEVDLGRFDPPVDRAVEPAFPEAGKKRTPLDGAGGDTDTDLFQVGGNEDGDFPAHVILGVGQEFDLERSAVAFENAVTVGVDPPRLGEEPSGGFRIVGEVLEVAIEGPHRR